MVRHLIVSTTMIPVNKRSEFDFRWVTTGAIRPIEVKLSRVELEEVTKDEPVLGVYLCTSGWLYVERKDANHNKLHSLPIRDIHSPILDNPEFTRRDMDFNDDSTTSIF